MMTMALKMMIMMMELMRSYIHRRKQIKRYETFFLNTFFYFSSAWPVKRLILLIVHSS